MSEFHWEPQPAAQSVVTNLITGFLARCPRARELSERMLHDTGTRFQDWVDSIDAPRSGALEKALLESGFEAKQIDGLAKDATAYRHDGAMFPVIILHGGAETRVRVKVDSVSDFLFAWAVPNDFTIEGEPGSPFRQSKAFEGDKAELWAVERHGNRGFAALKGDATRAVRAEHHLECLRRRKRDFENDADGFARVNMLVDKAIADLGVDWACDVFFEAERDYWQSRNRAAKVQKARQDSLGLGWANHDHHTYRSSRECFKHLIALLEKLGFTLRERFYAGAEAGWGAQVLEQPVAGITIFADVDMTPEELLGDFAHEGLPEREDLGTVGLWCGLHGDSVLQAGMHHLECQFAHEALRDQLAAANIGTMKPFTAFPFLRQAFTEGERWPVAEWRLQRLLDKGQITPAMAIHFRMDGAIGSHLENLERNDGYKGFNQQGVSDIIARTDPRKQDKKMPALVGA